MKSLTSTNTMFRRLARGLRTCALLAVTAMAIIPGAAARPKVAADTITAAEAFLKMPQQDLDLLSLSMRQDMLDYMVERDSVYKKSNIYMGLSWIETMRPDYMSVHLSDVSSLVINLLPQGKRLPLVMTLYTIDDGNGTSDTTVKFFDNSMQELPTAKFLKVPDPKDFYNIPKDSEITEKDIEEEMPFYTIEMTVNPTTGELTGRLTSADGLSPEQKHRLSPYIRKELHWIWTGKRMKLQK